MTKDLVGKTLGEYRLESVIGEGGLATVYRAYQISLNRPVAI
jgi:eukaryotic-like serine/threonine-protein kinase